MNLLEQHLTDKSLDMASIIGHLEGALKIIEIASREKEIQKMAREAIAKSEKSWKEVQSRKLP